MTINLKQQAFIEAYLETFNASEAARVARYTHPGQQGHRLLRNPKIQPIIEKRSGQSIADLTKTRVARRGCVYFVQVNNDAVKIGITDNFERRLKILDTSTPYPIKVLKVVYSTGYHSLEIELHKKFADKRIKGEWFALSSDDIKWIKECL